jgi:hypothetical protein
MAILRGKGSTPLPSSQNNGKLSSQLDGDLFRKQGLVKSGGVRIPYLPHMNRIADAIQLTSDYKRLILCKMKPMNDVRVLECIRRLLSMFRKCQVVLVFDSTKYKDVLQDIIKSEMV